MSTLLVIGITVLLIICITLVVILMKLNNTNIKSKTNNNSQNYQELNISNIEIPRKIEQMDEYSLSKACKVVFDSFKSLDYANKTPSKLDKVEWHTWQVSLIMAMIKMNSGSFVPNNNELFHKSIVGIDKNSLVLATQKIIDKYNNTIDIYKSRDELSQDIAWSSREVSILFYYMAKN